MISSKRIAVVKANVLFMYETREGTVIVMDKESIIHTSAPLKEALKLYGENEVMIVENKR